MLLANIVRVYEFLPVKHKITKNNKTMIDCLMNKQDPKVLKKIKSYKDFNGFNTEQSSVILSKPFGVSKGEHVECAYCGKISVPKRNLTKCAFEQCPSKANVVQNPEEKSMPMGLEQSLTLVSSIQRHELILSIPNF